MTAADRYALSLLPGPLRGTGLSSAEGSPQRSSDSAPGAPTRKGRGQPQQHSQNSPARGAQQQRPPEAGGPGSLQASKFPQGQRSPPLASAPAPALDTQMVNSWDNSLREILSALEPDGQNVRPVRPYFALVCTLVRGWGLWGGV